MYIPEFRSQNRAGSDTVHFIRAPITKVELSFETERWAACENANVNIGCKIVLGQKSNAVTMVARPSLGIVGGLGGGEMLHP